ncbi:MAG TPA: LysR family transcriptional regulator [Acidobacteriaceae bacterium]|nr:LysR family transcriptional regulator [Acidobacteriaceae bacterium]
MASSSRQKRKQAVSADTLRIRDFALLLALYEAGNLTGAALRVGITEPAASQQLRSIQRRVKMRLHESNHGGDKLTAEALALLPAAADIVQAYHRGMHDANEARHGGQRELRIGASSFLPEHWHRLLESVEMQVHRNIKLHLDLANTDQLLLALQRHDLDVALVISPPRNGKLTSRCVAKSPFMIVFREGHALAGRQSVSLTEVVSYPWIFFHKSDHPWLHDLILRRAEAAGDGVRIQHRVNHFDHVPRLLTDDRVLAWLTPTGAERVARPGLVARPLDDLEIRLETHLAALTSNTSPLVAEYFRCFLAQLEEDHSPVQLVLPLAGPIMNQSWNDARRVYKVSA